MTADSQLVKEAVERFRQGDNCAQAVAATLAAREGVDPAAAERGAAMFGGGVARTRQLCGAVAGMLMAAGWHYACPPTGDAAADAAQKQKLYAKGRAMMEEFARRNGSVVCAELLKGAGDEKAAHDTDPRPEMRSSAYYRKRPCIECVACAVAIWEEFVDND